MKMNIREENELDLNQISEIHNQAFNGSEEAKIVENLRKNKNLTISLVCEIDRKVVGHIVYSPIYFEDKIIGIGLAPVAVLPSFQKQGIGSRLIENGNRVAFSKGFQKILVLGDPAYYARFGFQNAKKYNYFSKFDPEGKHFMILEKDVEYMPEKIDIEYCKEFDV